MYVKSTLIKMPGGAIGADAFAELLRPAESSDEAVLDFTNVASVDSAGTDAICTLLNRMVANNRLGIVRVVGANRAMVRDFEERRLDLIFDLNPSRLAW